MVNMIAHADPASAAMLSDHARRVARLLARYPHQFSRPDIRLEWVPAWMGLIEQACSDVHEALPRGQEHRFSWLQIKEKFGELRMYWAVGQTDAAGRVSASDLEFDACWALASERIAKILETAERESRLIPYQREHE